MSESGNPSAGGHVLIVAAEPSMIASLRHRVATLARASGARDELVDDLRLVVSELATNVVQHTDSDTIRMTFRREPTRFVLDVDDAGALTGLEHISAPGPDRLAGRGLSIVRAVMDDVEIVDDDGRRRLRCTRGIS